MFFWVFCVFLVKTEKEDRVLERLFNLYLKALDERKRKVFLSKGAF